MGRGARRRLARTSPRPLLTAHLAAPRTGAPMKVLTTAVVLALIAGPAIAKTGVGNFFPQRYTRHVKMVTPLARYGDDVVRVTTCRRFTSAGRSSCTRAAATSRRAKSGSIRPRATGTLSPAGSALVCGAKRTTHSSPRSTQRWRAAILLSSRVGNLARSSSATTRPSTRRATEERPHHLECRGRRRRLPDAEVSSRWSRPFPTRSLGRALRRSPGRLQDREAAGRRVAGA